jgi:tricarballylate dehydrogenase
MEEPKKKFDVVVVGSGNAGLCAALSAREAGASVLLVEKAPEEWRGGNSFFTGGILRFTFQGIDDIKSLVPDLSEQEIRSIEVEPYSEDQFYNDMLRITEYLTDADLALTLIRNSFPTMQWLRDKGVRWTLAFGRQSFRVKEKFRFWGGLVVEAVGGGPGLVGALFERAARDGIEIRYGSKATRLVLSRDGRITGIELRGAQGFYEVYSPAIVLASGGFEANAEWRCRYLGKDWELAKVRGTPYNTGDGIKMALDIGAQPFGHWSSCHAVAWDLNAPPFGDRKVGELFQKHSYPLGIVVNVKGERFLDEGADFRNYTYAEYGRRILGQPQRVAFQIFDSKVLNLLREEYRIREVTKAEASTIEELATKLEIDGEGMARTVREFNAAVQPGEFNPAILDGKGTKGIAPPKTNWALPIDTPPFVGFAVTTGITFTFGGLRISPKGEVLDTENRPIPGLYGAGELVGGLFYFNYPGASGLMSGAVFGRLSGREAAGYATHIRNLAKSDMG